MKYIEIKRKGLILMKAFLLLFACAVSFSAHAGLFDFFTSKVTSNSNKCNDLQMQDYKNGMAPMPIFSATDSNQSLDVLEKNEGIGRFISELPKTYRDIFFDDKDFSDQAIQKNADAADLFWSKEFSSEIVNSFRSHNFDYIAFGELNLKASLVWKNMVDCNSGSITQARSNYFKGNPCGATAENANLISQLKELNENYSTFVKSSGLIKFINYNMEGLSISYQHPLLVQIELQMLAVTINAETEAHRADMVVLQRYEMERDQSKSDFSMSNKYIRQQHEERMRAFDSAGISQWYNMIINASAIASAHQIRSTEQLSESCSEFGLWPAMNRSILYFLHPYKNSYNSSMGEIKPIGSEIIQNLNKCGRPLEPVLVGFGTYSKFAYSHLYESKRLFGRYWNEKTNPEFSQVIDKSNTTPFQNLICTE